MRREHTRILRMASVDDIGKHPDDPVLIDETRFQRFLAVDHRDLFAFTQIGDDIRPLLLGYPEGHAPATAAAIQSEYEPGMVGRSPVHPRIDT